MLADITFIGSTIKSLQVNNKVTKLPAVSSVNINVGVSDPSITSITDEEVTYLHGVLQLQIDLNITNDTEEVLSEISLLLEGAYRIDSGVDRNEFNDLVRFNGLANLYTVARSEIITFTSHIYSEGKVV